MTSFVNDPVSLQRYLEMAKARFPGPDYYDALREIHRSLQPRTYIEIGVRSGESLACALPETKCIGVDPNPVITFPIPPDTTLIPTTSDDYFALQAAESASFDLAFIDGLHLFEQALRDFIQLERRAHRASVILIHDCIPLDQVSSARVRTTDFYCGDVWKLPLCLQKYRPGLRQGIVPAAPSGLCIVSGLDAASTTLQDRYDGIVAEFVGLDYSAFADAGPHPGLIPNEREQIAAYVATSARKWK
jgi:hypothetical protein